jgi:GH15 family glucan-1,4-alpha-glucosidase
VWLYHRGYGRTLDRDTGRRLAAMADLVCEIWRRPDAGIWEVRSEPVHFTHSKMMCWVALDRAARLAEEGELPAGNAGRWRREADAVRRFVEERCFSEEKRAWVRFEGSDELDASTLLAPVMGYCVPEEPRLAGTIDAVRRELGQRGPLLRRYSGGDGVRGRDGCFLACSFWLVEALALAGRLDVAAETMEEALGLANDVGLYAEEIDASTGEFLGNFPQGLVHLALVSAAACIARLEA